MVIDVIGICAAVLIWFPFLLFILGLCVNVFFCEFKSAKLKREYDKTLTEEQRKFLEEYKENTTYYLWKQKQRNYEKKDN